MKRTTLILISFACVLVIVFWLIIRPILVNRSTPPNIVFFLVDDLGWRDVGCYGSSFYETPHIDQLAAEGVRFNQAYAACPVCSPTRASILTGKYPARLQLTDWLPGRRDFPFQKLNNANIIQSLPLEEETLAEALKAQGYSTAIYGKWHLGENPAGPLSQGFDVQVPNWNKGWPNLGYHAPFGLDETGINPSSCISHISPCMIPFRDDWIWWRSIGRCYRARHVPKVLTLSWKAIRMRLNSYPEIN
jgi:arylsulfatase A-like enzyme